MPYSESWPREESELPPDELSEELSLLEELLPEPVEAEPAIVVPVDFPSLLSVVLPSFLEDEPDLAFEEDDLDPEAEVLLLLSLDAEEVEPEVEPVLEPEGELEPEVEPELEPKGEVEPESLFAPNALVLPDDELELLDEPPD